MVFGRRRWSDQRVAVLRTVGVRGLALASAFLLSALVARVLGPAEAGTFFLIYPLIMLFATVGRFGTDNLALRLLGGDTRSPRSDMRSILIIASAGGCLAGLIIVPFVLSVEGFNTPVLSVFLALSVLAQSVAVVAGTVLRGLGKLGAGVLAELGSVPTITVVILFVAELIHAETISLSLALVALSVATWVTAIWALLHVRRTIRSSLLGDEADALNPRQFLSVHSRRLVPMMATSSLVYAVVWAPVFILSIVATRTDVAYYSVAIRLANLVTLLPAIQISYLAPDFARRFYSGDLEGLNTVAGRTTLQISLVTFLPVVGLVGFSSEILQLVYGVNYTSAASVLSILAIAAFIVVLCGQVNQLMLLCGLETRAMILTLISLGVWATAGLFFGSEYGSLGVACVAGVTTSGYAILATISLRCTKGIRSYLAFK